MKLTEVWTRPSLISALHIEEGVVDSCEDGKVIQYSTKIQGQDTIR